MPEILTQSHATCVCCNAPVIVLPRMSPTIAHGRDRISGELCPRIEWPVMDAIRTDDDA